MKRENGSVYSYMYLSQSIKKMLFQAGKYSKDMSYTK